MIQFLDLYPEWIKIFKALVLNGGSISYQKNPVVKRFILQQCQLGEVCLYHLVCLELQRSSIYPLAASKCRKHWQLHHVFI